MWGGGLLVITPVETAGLLLQHPATGTFVRLGAVVDILL